VDVVGRPKGMRNRVTLLAAVLAFAVVVGGVAVMASRSGGPGTGRALPRLPAGTASSSASGSAQGAGAFADQSNGPTDAIAMPVRLSTYVLDSGVERPADHATAYRLAPVTQARFEALAKALGASGAVVQGGQRLMVSDADHELSIDTVSGVWSLSLMQAAPVAGFATTCKPCPPNAVCTPSCEQPAKPEGMPSRDEAEKAARAFWSKAGVDPGDADVKVDDNTFQWYVHFAPEVGGVGVSGLDIGVAIGPHSQVDSATGWLSGANAVNLGDYPLVTLPEAVVRLNAMPYGPACLHTTPRCLPAARLESPTATAGIGQAAGGSASGSTGAAKAPTPPEPATGPVEPPSSTVVTAPASPTTAVLTITTARLGLAQIDGYLVPVYLFTTATGAQAPPVPAVPDRLLEPPTTSTTGPGKPTPVPAPGPAAG